MKITQVYQLLNEVTEQVVGLTDIKVIDSSTLVSLGNEILSSTANKDNFLKTFVDRIGKTVINNRNYEANIKSILLDNFEFGAILQKMYVEPMEAENDPAWDIVDGDTVDQFRVSKPKARQKLFEGTMAWQIRVTVFDHQLQTAFISAEAMAAFTTAIFTQMSNSMELKLESASIIAYSNFIAHLLYKGGLQSINLLWGYNQLHKTTLTANTALVNPDFLKYASAEIRKVSKKMRSMSTLYNVDGVQTFSREDMQRISILSDFASNMTTYLESDTFHKELVALPNYNEINYWSGTATDSSFENVSMIEADIADPTNPTAPKINVSQSGIICLISDKEAIGVTINDRRMTNAYNAEGEYTNYFNKARIGHFNDLSLNGVVFYVA